MTLLLALLLAADPATSHQVSIPLEDYEQLRKQSERPALTVVDLLRVEGSFGRRDLVIALTGRASGSWPTADVLQAEGARLHSCEGDALLSRSETGAFAVTPLAPRFSLRCRVALDGGALTQMEALVRWNHPERGILLPAEFLAVMAETGTIVVLGQWLVDTVCAQIAQWQEEYAGPVTVAVNLSHREFWSAHLLATVTGALARHRLEPECLILEITESVIMSDPDAARQIMSDLHAAGIRMHIDDFGTGQSSLHALRAFPVDALKIDQSFIHQIDVDHQTTELVRIIVGMGRTLGLEVVAEGVETAAQADRLRTMGCATAQGWLYAAAVPGDEAGRMLGRALSPQLPSQR